VDTSRILKDNEENRKLQEELRNEYKTKAPSKSLKVKGSTGDKSKKRKYNQDKAIDGKYKIEIPLPLRKKLVDDWAFITCQKYLLALPRNPTVANILDQYLASDHIKPNKFEEIIPGIRSYFDKVLGTLLLYRFERHQYSETLKKFNNVTISQIYGLEHLLRLLVKFPQILSSVDMEEEAAQTLKATLIDLTKFLVTNFININSPYEPATPQYIRLAS